MTRARRAHNVTCGHMRYTFVVRGHLVVCSVHGEESDVRSGLVGRGRRDSRVERGWSLKRRERSRPQGPCAGSAVGAVRARRGARPPRASASDAALRYRQACSRRPTRITHTPFRSRSPVPLVHVLSLLTRGRGRKPLRFAHGLGDLLFRVDDIPGDGACQLLRQRLLSWAVPGIVRAQRIV